MTNIIFNDKTIENIKNIIWDKDGTLTDVHLYWGEIIKRRAKAIIKEYNLNSIYYEKICSMLGLNLQTGKLKEEGPVGVLSRQEILEKLNEYLLNNKINSEQEINEKIFDEVHKEFRPYIFEYVRLLPYVTETLKKFKDAGLKQYIITSDTSENALSITKRLGIYEYFNKIWGKNEVPYPKKTGIPALKLMEQEGLNPKETICIGDTKMDFDMAYNSKCYCILVASGQIPKNALSNYTDSIQSLNDITIK